MSEPGLTKNRGGRKPKYPWSLWLDYNEHHIIAGKDFDCAIKNMQNRLYHTARDKDMRVSTNLLQDQGNVIGLSFTFAKE